jgi:hypothetical protein
MERPATLDDALLQALRAVRHIGPHEHITDVTFGRYHADVPKVGGTFYWKVTICRTVGNPEPTPEGVSYPERLHRNEATVMAEYVREREFREHPERFCPNRHRLNGEEECQSCQG